MFSKSSWLSKPKELLYSVSSLFRFTSPNSGQDQPNRQDENQQWQNQQPQKKRNLFDDFDRVLARELGESSQAEPPKFHSQISQSWEEPSDQQEFFQPTAGSQRNLSLSPEPGPAHQIGAPSQPILPYPPNLGTSDGGPTQTFSTSPTFGGPPIVQTPINSYEQTPLQETFPIKGSLQAGPHATYSLTSTTTTTTVPPRSSILSTMQTSSGGQSFPSEGLLTENNFTTGVQTSSQRRSSQPRNDYPSYSTQRPDPLSVFPSSSPEPVLTADLPIYSDSTSGVSLQPFQYPTASPSSQTPTRQRSNTHEDDGLTTSQRKNQQSRRKLNFDDSERSPTQSPRLNARSSMSSSVAYSEGTSLSTSNDNFSLQYPSASYYPPLYPSASNNPLSPPPYTPQQNYHTTEQRYALNPYETVSSQQPYVPPPDPSSTSLPPPLPPPSDYWRQKAKETTPAPVIASGYNPRVDYSDCDYSSMDFSYGAASGREVQPKGREKPWRKKSNVDRGDTTELVLASSDAY